jgi:hypothetical protein
MSRNGNAAEFEEWQSSWDHCDPSKYVYFCLTELTVAHLVKTFLPFMEIGVPLLFCSQKPTTGSCYKADHAVHILYFFKIIFFHTCFGFH